MTEQPVRQERFEQIAQFHGARSIADELIAYGRQEHAAREAADREAAGMWFELDRERTRRQAAEATTERVRDVHCRSSDGDTSLCDEDGHVYPCATIRALDSQLPAGQETTE